MKDKIVIYPAAALFNGRETYFNSKLVEGLEEVGYETNLPQRDGFEFGNLAKALAGKIPEDQIGSAVQNVIYFLDMGVFIPKSDVILTNLDQPIDEGVVVEASYAKLMGKFVLGFRTDVRSPYGSIEDNFGGMHFFPGYQTSQFFSQNMNSKTLEEGDREISSLVQKIDSVIRKSNIFPGKKIPSYVNDNPNFQQIFEGADLLFKGIKDIHSEKGLEEIASRYIGHKKRLEKIGPKF